MSGSGQIIQRDTGVPRAKCRNWELRMSLGRDPMTGRYKTKSKRFYGTYREAQAELRSWEPQDVTSASRCPTVQQTMEDFLARRRVAEGTLAKNRYQAACIVRHLGNMRLCDLSARVISAAFDRLAAGDSPSGKPLSGTYLQGVHALLHAMLADAEQARQIDSCARLMPSAPKNTTQRKRALTGDSVALLVESCEPSNDYHTCIMLSLLAGLRRGECCRCLKWSDVDFESATLHVPGTKTKASDAVVPLPELLASFLKRRAVERGRRGFVVSLSPQSVTEWWIRHRDELGCSGVAFHGLRHTYVTMLARAGVHPSVMQALARHSDSRTTMEIYTHVQLEQQRAGVQALESILSATNSATNNRIISYPNDKDFRRSYIERDSGSVQAI